MKAIITSRSVESTFYHLASGPANEVLEIMGRTQDSDFKLIISSRGPLNIPLDSDIDMEITLKVTPKQTSLVKTFK